MRGASKVQSKPMSSLEPSSAAAKSDHLTKLNLDIGSLVEVRLKNCFYLFFAIFHCVRLFFYFFLNQRSIFR